MKCDIIKPTDYQQITWKDSNFQDLT